MQYAYAFLFGFNEAAAIRAVFRPYAGPMATDAKLATENALDRPVEARLML
jgi:hypothetical protein